MKSLFGGLFLGCGILIAGLSGLCTLLVAGSALMETGGQDAAEMFSMIPAVLVAGGIPFAIGLAFFFLGRHLLRSAREERPTGPDQADTFR